MGRRDSGHGHEHGPPQRRIPSLGERLKPVSSRKHLHFDFVFFEIFSEPPQPELRKTRNQTSKNELTKSQKDRVPAWAGSPAHARYLVVLGMPPPPPPQKNLGTVAS